MNERSDSTETRHEGRKDGSKAPARGQPVLSEMMDRIRMLADGVSGCGLTIQNHYQIQVGVDTETPHGAEVLGRIVDDATGRRVSPAEFLPVLTEMPERMMTWTRAAMNQALDDLPWLRQASGFGDFSVSINVPPSLVAEGLLDAVRHALRERPHLGSGALGIELTEEGRLQRETLFVRALEDLRASGARIALDDVGAMKGNFRLDRLDVLLATFRMISEFKLDRCLLSSPHLRTVIGRLFDEGKNVVIEGVEGRRQMDFLREYTVRPDGNPDQALIQGYLFHQPQNVAGVADWLRARGEDPAAAKTMA